MRSRAPPEGRARRDRPSPERRTGAPWRLGWPAGAGAGPGPRPRRPSGASARAAPARRCQRDHDRTDRDRRSGRGRQRSAGGEPRDPERPRGALARRPQRRGQGDRDREGDEPVGDRVRRLVPERDAHDREPRRHPASDLAAHREAGGRRRQLSREHPRHDHRRGSEQRTDEHGRADEEGRSEGERIPRRLDPGETAGVRAQELCCAEAGRGVGRRPAQEAVRQSASLQPERGRLRRARAAAQVEGDVREREEGGDEGCHGEKAPRAPELGDARELDHAAQPLGAPRDRGDRCEQAREGEGDLSGSVGRPRPLAPEGGSRGGREGG